MTTEATSIHKSLQKIVPKSTRAQLRLPAEQREALGQIVAQMRLFHPVPLPVSPGVPVRIVVGVSVLCAGSPDTARKIAEVLANELGLALFRIDLRAVVSKYIGETERNLRKVFDEAEHSGAVLFFDEADALFGKRSGVKDADDRYANLEAAYLLSRMESYNGLAILCTNLRQKIDEALSRRFRFVLTCVEGPA